jgi:hypothetical protein
MRSHRIGEIAKRGKRGARVYVCCLGGFPKYMIPIPTYQGEGAKSQKPATTNRVVTTYPSTLLIITSTKYSTMAGLASFLVVLLLNLLLVFPSSSFHTGRLLSTHERVERGASSLFSTALPTQKLHECQECTESTFKK